MYNLLSDDLVWIFPPTELSRICGQHGLIRCLYVYRDFYRLIFINFLPILNCKEQLLLLPFTSSGVGDVLLSVFRALYKQIQIAEDYSSLK